MATFEKNWQYKKFCAYGFLKNLRFFDAFLLLFLLEKGLSYTEIGVIYATREVIINFSEIPSGILADTLGRKYSLMASFMAYILSFSVFFFATDLVFFIGAMILFGIADAFRSGTHKGMIMDYLKLNGWSDQKVHYYGHTRSWSQFGSALSALAAGLLVLYFGSYRNVFLFSIIPYLLNFINIATYPEEINFSSKKKNLGKKRSFLGTFKSFFTEVKKPNVFRILNSTAMHSAYLKAVKDYIQPIMVGVALLMPLTINDDPTKKSGIVIGIIYFFIFLMTSYASRNAGKFAAMDIKHLPLRSMLVGFMAGLTCGLFYNFDLLVVALLAFIMIYILENIRKPILTGSMADNVPNDILTSVLSGQAFYQTILTSAIALTMGIVADYAGVGIALAISSGILMIGALLTGPIRKIKLNESVD
ncbi:MAG: MFS transporter [Bacteroidota bacterium]